MNRRHNKIVIITGGASSIGKGLCERLAQAGASELLPLRYSTPLTL